MTSTLTKRIPVDSWSGLEQLVGPLQRYLHGRCSCVHDVQDALQETLLRAARYRKPGMELGRLRAWALTIAANVVRDQSRKRGRSPSVGHEDAVFSQFTGREPDPADTDTRPPLRVADRWFEMDQLVLHLREALAELCEQDRLALHWFYTGDGSTQVAARELQLSPSLVKVRLFRARQRLRRRMELLLARTLGQGLRLQEI